MPDLLAGTIVNALDTPPTVVSVQTGTFTFNVTAYGVATTGGTYVDCGIAFTAPTTGRVVVWFRSQLLNNTGGQSTFVSFVLRDGSTVGSGASVLAASDTRALIHAGTDTPQAGTFETVTGLTPGNAYNVRMEHRVTGGVGTLLNRSISVAPAT